MENRFYICEHCGNLIGMIHDAGVPMMCCGQKMTKLEAGTVEASREKHIPVVNVEDNIVKAVKDSGITEAFEEAGKGIEKAVKEAGIDTDKLKEVIEKIEHCKSDNIADRNSFFISEFFTKINIFCSPFLSQFN